MRYKLLLLVSVFFLYTNTIEGPKNSFKVMAWNILHGGNDIENGPENVAKIIKEINPDIILMVETYGSGPFIANYLNYNFHLIALENGGVDEGSPGIRSDGNYYAYVRDLDNNKICAKYNPN